MAYEYPVKWITNTMRGAPQISGTAGTLIGALDAFLLSGWGTTTAISVTVADGVGTATFTEGSYFEGGAVVLIAGVTSPAALNGEARVLSRTNSSITFETDAPDGTATTSGSITFKYAPVGSWEKAFSGTNLAAYRSLDVQSSGHYLRVDDAGTASARVRGFESMGDANTGAGPFPTDMQLSGGGYWYKSSAANANAVNYTIAADSRALLVALAPGTASNPTYRAANVRGFGDPIALAPAGDAWATFLSAVGASTSYFESGSLSGGGGSDNSGFVVCPRSWVGLAGAQYLGGRAYTGGAASRSGEDAYAGTAPSVIDGQIKLSRLFLYEQTAGAPPRSVIPGVLYVPQAGLRSLISCGDILAGSGDFSGRNLLAVGVGNNISGAPLGIAFLDISGPWR